MYSRFNFYDFYAYLIPGLAAVALAMLPFVVGGLSVPVQLSAALVAAVVGYVVGLLLHEVAREVVPSEFLYGKGIHRRYRYPSEFLLDDKCSWWGPEYRKNVAELIWRDFGLQVGGQSSAKVLSRIRQNAFMACRARIVVAGQAAYTEQIQGMYGMWRGLGVALGLAACGWLGCFAAAGLAAGPEATSILLGAASFLVLMGLADLGHWLKSTVWFRRSVGAANRKRLAGISRWWKRLKNLMLRKHEMPTALVVALSGSAALLFRGSEPMVPVVVASVTVLVYSIVFGRFALLAFVGFAAASTYFSYPDVFVPLFPASAAVLAFLSARAMRSNQRFAEDYAKSVYQFFRIVAEGDRTKEANVALGAVPRSSEVPAELL